MLRLRFQQRLTGAYGLGLDPRAHLGLPLAIQADLSTPGLGRLLREGLGLGGTITAAGLANRQAIEGRVSLSRLPILSVYFSFPSDSGVGHAFTGATDLTPGKLARSLTGLGGTIATATGAPIGRAWLRFDLRRELWPSLRSIDCRV
jgi:hypothetical protein